MAAIDGFKVEGVNLMALGVVRNFGRLEEAVG